MIKVKNKRVLVAIALIGVAGSAGVVTAAIAGQETSEVTAMRAKLAAISKYAGQSYAAVRAAGGNPDEADRVGRTPSGLDVSAVQGDTEKCVLTSDGNAFCATSDQVRMGQSLSVSNDCSRPKGDMLLTTVLPDDATSAGLVLGDGTALPMTVEQNIAWLEAPTPPNGVSAEIRATNRSGAEVVRLAMPGDFCPGG